MFVSNDNGLTWRRTHNHVAGYKPHPTVLEVNTEEYLSISPVAFNLQATSLTLPPTVGHLDKEKGIPLHHYDNCPPDLQTYMREMPARWTSQIPT